MLDIPILTSKDDNSGFYAVAYAGAGSSLAGSDVFVSADGSNYSHLVTLQQAGTVGVATTALPAPAAVYGTWLTSQELAITDTTHSITVSLSSGNLYSAIVAELSTGANLALVGQELLQFESAVQNANGSYTLSKLRRGRKGSNPLIPHVAGETFVLLGSAATRLLTPLELNGLQRYYKVVAPGQSIDTVSAIQFANTDACLRPYSPVDLVATRSGGGDFSLAWKRRSRISDASISGFLPLGESNEAYEIDVLDSTGSIKRTLTTSSPAATYSNTEVLTDFGVSQTSLHIRIYQLSTTIGRGSPLDATVQ